MLATLRTYDNFTSEEMALQQKIVDEMNCN